MPNLLKVLLWSMIPIAELRASIPLGIIVYDLPWYSVYIAAVIGSMLPVPIILLFVRRVFEIMKRWGGKFEKIALFFEGRGVKNSDKVTKYATFGLFLFVAVPLPGTGAWMGSLIAALMNMRFKHSIISVLLGVMTAGVLMTMISAGVITGLDSLMKIL